MVRSYKVQLMPDVRWMASNFWLTSVFLMDHDSRHVNLLFLTCFPSV